MLYAVDMVLPADVTDKLALALNEVANSEWFGAMMETEPERALRVVQALEGYARAKAVDEEPSTRDFWMQKVSVMSTVADTIHMVRGLS